VAGQFESPGRFADRVLRRGAKLDGLSVVAQNRAVSRRAFTRAIVQVGVCMNSAAEISPSRVIRSGWSRPVSEMGVHWLLYPCEARLSGAISPIRLNRARATLIRILYEWCVTRSELPASVVNVRYGDFPLTCLGRQTTYFPVSITIAACSERRCTCSGGVWPSPGYVNTYDLAFRSCFTLPPKSVRHTKSCGRLTTA
jgi:hypothetical protein